MNSGLRQEEGPEKQAVRDIASGIRRRGCCIHWAEGQAAPLHQFGLVVDAELKMVRHVMSLICFTVR